MGCRGWHASREISPYAYLATWAFSNIHVWTFHCTTLVHPGCHTKLTAEPGGLDRWCPSANAVPCLHPHSLPPPSEHAHSMTVLPPLSPGFRGRGVGGEGAIRVASAKRSEAAGVAPCTDIGSTRPRTSLRRGSPPIPSPSPPGSPGEKGARTIRSRWSVLPRRAPRIWSTRDSATSGCGEMGFQDEREASVARAVSAGWENLGECC